MTARAWRNSVALFLSVMLSLFILGGHVESASAQTPARNLPNRYLVERKPAQRKSTVRSKSTVRKKSAPAKASGRFAVVVAPSTQIYEKPDLDAKVIATVQQGVKIPVSKGTRGEFAKFHRTRVAGRLGWVLILDVKPEAAAKKVLAEVQAQAAKPGPFASDSDAETDADNGEPSDGSSRKQREPFAFSRSVSLVLGQTQYKESVGGQDFIASLLHYGFKITGPDILFSGPLMDVNVVLHYGAPPYNEAMSSIKPSGFVMWTDANLLLPVFFRDNTLVALGVGPLLVIANTQTAQGDQTSSRWRTELGATVELTAGHRFDDISVRLEGKYMFEDKTYHQFQLAIGTVF